MNNNQAQHNIARAMSRPHTALGMWALLLALAVLTLTTYATSALCNDFRWLSFSLAIVILIVAIIVMVVYNPVFAANRACLLYLSTDKFKGKTNSRTNQDMMKTLLSSTNTLYFYFLFMGVSVVIISIIVAAMSGAQAGCLPENNTCNLASMQLASLYTGAMVTSIVLTIVFGTLVIKKTASYSEGFNSTEINREKSLAQAAVTVELIKYTSTLTSIVDMSKKTAGGVETAEQVD